MRVIAVIPPVVCEAENFADVVTTVERSTMVCNTVQLVLGSTALAWVFYVCQTDREMKSK